MFLEIICSLEWMISRDTGDYEHRFKQEDGVPANYSAARQGCWWNLTNFKRDNSTEFLKEGTQMVNKYLKKHIQHPEPPGKRKLKLLWDSISFSSEYLR